MIEIRIQVKESIANNPIIKTFTYDNWNILLDYAISLYDSYGNIQKLLSSENQPDNTDLIILELKKKNIELNTEILTFKDKYNVEIERKLNTASQEERKRYNDKLTRFMVENRQDIENEYKDKLTHVNDLLELSRINEAKLAQKIRENYETENAKYKIESEHENTKLNDTIKILEERLLSERTNTSRELNKVIESYATEMKNLYDKNKDKDQMNNITFINKFDQQSSAINNIIEELKPIKKYFVGTNDEKGKGGENRIEQILLQNARFTDAIITNTSKQADEGDMHFAWNKMKCIIEIKNKKILTKDDITKFRNNIFSSNNANCGIFVSLITHHFSSIMRDYIQFDLVDHKPLVYIYLQKNEDLDYAILSLSHILNKSKDNSSTIDDFIIYLNKYTTLLKTLLVNLETRKKKITVELKQIHKEIILYEQELLNSVEAGKNNPIITLHDSPQTSVQLSTILDVYINSVLEKRQMLATDMYELYSESLIRTYGGYTKICQMAIESFIPTILTKDILSSLVEYYKTNKKHMPLKDMITLIRQVDYRKLGLFTNNKPYGYICNVVQSKSI